MTKQHRDGGQSEAPRADSAALVHHVAMETLGRYLSNPWTWIRESDLVPDLVRQLTEGLHSSSTTCNLQLVKGSSRLQPSAGVTPTVPRVRTEIKLVKAPPRDVDEPDYLARAAGTDRKRTDIAILKQAPVTLFVHANGARDVVLKTLEADVEVALEVKLYPDLYLKSGASYWIQDVDKLLTMEGAITRGVLLVDTSLPLVACGMTYRTPRLGSVASLERKQGRTARWPLVAREEMDVRAADGHRLLFTPATQAIPGEVHVWALALKPGVSWRPAFAKGLVPQLPAEEVVPACWVVRRG